MFLATIKQHNAKLLTSITSSSSGGSQIGLLRDSCYPDFNPCTVTVFPAGGDGYPYFEDVWGNPDGPDSSGLDREAEEECFMQLSCQLTPLKHSVLKIMQHSCGTDELGLQNIGHCSSTDMGLEHGMFGLECFYLKDSSMLGRQDGGGLVAGLPVNRHFMGASSSSGGDGSSVVIRGPVIVAASVGLESEHGWLMLAIIHMPESLLQKQRLKDGLMSCVHKCISAAVAPPEHS